MKNKIISNEKIPLGWTKVTLDNLLYIKGRIGWKGLKKKEYLNEGYLILNGDNVQNNRIDLENSGRISKERFDESPEIILKENDIIMTKDGTIGKMAYISELKEPTTIASGLFLIRNISEKLNQKYLWYVFQSKFFKRFIKERVEGSVIPHLYQRDFEEFEILLPSLGEQKKVIKLLQLIDKKIELNEKMSKSLEVTAKSLFKSWFIDFDPVEAKSKNKPTKFSKEIEILFPNSFTNSEIGKIPKGWKIENIESIAVKVTEKFMKKEDWSKEKLIDLSRMPKKSISLNFYGKGEELSTSVCKFKKYDFLFGSIRPYFFKAGICPFDGVSNSSVFILRSIKKYDREFLYFYSSSESIFKKSVQYSEGTKMPVIKWKDYKEFKFALPDKKIRETFSSIINPMVKKILLNNEENEILTDLKKNFISKLISDEKGASDMKKIIFKAFN